MNKSKVQRTNDAIHKAIKLYFDGKKTECFDLMDTLSNEPLTGTEKSRLKKNLVFTAGR